MSALDFLVLAICLLLAVLVVVAIAFVEIYGRLMEAESALEARFDEYGYYRYADGGRIELSAIPRVGEVGPEILLNPPRVDTGD